MRDKIFHCLLVVFLLAVLLGCTGGNATSSVTPSQTTLPTSTRTVETVTPMPTQDNLPTSNVALQVSNVAVFMEGNDDLVYILDESLDILSTFPDKYPLLTLQSDDCSLIGYYYLKGEVTVIFSDQNGQEINRETTKTIGVPEDVYQFTISPSGQWMAFKNASGVIRQSYYYAEFQDVMLLKLDKNEPQDALLLTENGGAIGGSPVWSPDSLYLAFSDKDQNNIPQIFIYTPATQNKIQLTNFGKEMADHIVTELRFSPDSSLLAFSTESRYRFETSSDGFVGIITLESQQIKWVRAEVTDTINTDLWWNKKGEILLFLANHQFSSTQPSESSLVWYRTRDDAIVHTLLQSDLGSETFLWLIFPITDDLDLVGIIGDDVYIYNLSDQSYDDIGYPEYFIGKIKFITSPSGSLRPFPCKYP